MRDDDGMFKGILEKFKKNNNGYPTINIEESFRLEGKEGDTIFRVIFEVPVPVSRYADKKDIEEFTKITDDTFRPIVYVLTHYLRGLSTENSPERFVLGRTNLINAIKQCAMAQLKTIEDAEKNR